jgi:hypothetical protein
MGTSKGPLTWRDSLDKRPKLWNMGIIKSRKIWAGHIARMEGKKNSYRLLAEKLEGKRH